jgi:hypothetical protein
VWACGRGGGPVQVRVARICQSFRLLTDMGMVWLS